MISKYKIKLQYLFEIFLYDICVFLKIFELYIKTETSYFWEITKKYNNYNFYNIILIFSILLNICF